MNVTDGDREKADRLAQVVGAIWDTEPIAVALAEERERARVPFLRLAESFARQDYQEWTGDELAELLRHAAEESQ